MSITLLHLQHTFDLKIRIRSIEHLNICTLGSIKSELLTSIMAQHRAQVPLSSTYVNSHLSSVDIFIHFLYLSGFSLMRIKVELPCMVLHLLSFIHLSTGERIIFSLFSGHNNTLRALYLHNHRLGVYRNLFKNHFIFVNNLFRVFIHDFILIYYI